MFKQDKILRLAFITGDGKATTFSTNLNKLICAVLFDTATPQSAYSISEILKSDYGLTFTVEEIEKVITHSHYKQNFVEVLDAGKTGYTLSPEKIDALKPVEEQYRIDVIINEFIEETSTKSSVEEIKGLVTDFLYQTFNMNSKTIFALINKEFDQVVNSIYVNNNNEKKIINEFLNWDNQRKDKFVFNTISYCIDYCMLTVKNDNDYLANVFSGKSFFIDANIILRLIGFNNQERKKVSTAFVEKCSSCNISLKYTNFTYDEVIKTIGAFTEHLSKERAGRVPLSERNYQRFAPKNQYSDISLLYLEWCKQPGNKYNDYHGFKKQLIKDVNEALKDFQIVHFPSYENSKPDVFINLVASLRKHKDENGRGDHRRTPTNSLSVDINNYLYISEKRASEKGKNMFDINTYMISADSKLCEWGNKQFPSPTPICILPSVWYSLLLKLKGRTEDDYRSFGLYLNLRYKEDTSTNEKTKADILKIVENLDDTADIKNKILDLIYDEMDNDIIAPIEDTMAYVIEKENIIITREIEKFKRENGVPYIERGKFLAYEEMIEADALKMYNRKTKWGKIISKTKVIIGSIVLLFFVVLFISGNMQTLLTNPSISALVDTLPYFSILVITVIVKPIGESLNKRDLDYYKVKASKRIHSKYAVPNNEITR